MRVAFRCYPLKLRAAASPTFLLVARAHRRPRLAWPRDVFPIVQRERTSYCRPHDATVRPRETPEQNSFPHRPRCGSSSESHGHISVSPIGGLMSAATRRAISTNDGDRPLRATEDQLVRCRVCVAQAASLSGMRSSCVRPGSSKGAALDRSRPIPQAGSHRGGGAEDVKLESAGADPGILTQKTRGRCHGRRQHVRRRYARCS